MHVRQKVRLAEKPALGSPGLGVPRPGSTVETAAAFPLCSSVTKAEGLLPEEEITRGPAKVGSAKI